MATASNGASVWSLEFGWGEVHEVLDSGNFVVWFNNKEENTVNIETYNSSWERITKVKTARTLFTYPQEIIPITFNSYIGQ